MLVLSMDLFMAIGSYSGNSRLPDILVGWSILLVFLVVGIFASLALAYLIFLFNLI